MLNIKREDIPAWYEIGWNGKKGSLTIGIHELFIDQMRETLSRTNAPIIVEMSERTKVPYLPPTENQWGFGQVLQLSQSAKTPFMTWEIPLQPGNLLNISASLAVLFLYLRYPREEISWQSLSPQLVLCNLVLIEESAPLSVEFSKAVACWLKKFPPEAKLPTVSRAMQEAHSKMRATDRDDFAAMSINARIGMTKGCIHFNCPGDACGLDPDFLSEPSERGYELQPHNVDNVVQQLTLLVGVAALCDLYRTENP
jgi:hypothetical protein